ncbi:hypothetical protein K4L06_21315 [Lysobacter sp. BMK333-48F3]|uniref:hypothetical protein n=1 Tax=Lysobacter sp. BMK333-48F3 TaxID=2867962 RepID=UPI001C8BBE2E|nr:hypothetical protein [Lysobacter sp. BMK333-48F3]MBX9403852.1 hypothetical protein [Lysobacter sp. BMK333-48F3]
MQRLQDAIDQYNASRARYWDDDYNTLLAAGPAEPAQLERLQALEPAPLPAELVAFYRRYGGLHNRDNTESHCMELPAPEQLADGLEQADGYARIRSLGLADMIVYSWGNDRPEFAPGRAFSQADLDELNGRYRCYGWYRTYTVLESAWYLYADPDGRFGALFYDQDRFDAAARELRALLAASPARQSLEQALCEGVERMRAAMIEWCDEDA